MFCHFSVLSFYVWTYFLYFIVIVEISAGGVGKNKAEKEKSNKIIALIEHALSLALESFHHDKNSIVPFLIQDVNLALGFTTYKWPETNQVAFRRKTLDNHLTQLIFPTGKYFKGTYHDESSYYTLMYRGKENRTIYFLKGIYIRNDGPNPSIEWTHSDIWLPEKSKEENDFCQGKACGFPEFLLGTCFIVDRQCNTKDEIPVIPTHKSKHEGSFQFLKKEDEDDDDEDEGIEESDEQLSRKKRMIMSNDYYKKYSDYFKSNSTGKASLHVPTSFDLLQLWVEEDKENGKREFLFKNRIDRRRKRKSMEEDLGMERTMDLETMIQALACLECHRLGNFYKDLEEDPFYSQAIGAWLEKMVQNGKLHPVQRQKNSEVLFVGYGLCSHEMKGRSRPDSIQVGHVIDFYLSALKINCKIHARLAETVKGWLRQEEPLLKILPDRSVGLHLGNRLLKRPWLSRNEYDTLFFGLLFSKFTSVYNEQSFLNEDEKKRMNLTISEEIKFLTRVFLQTLDTLRSHLPHHTIKMTRSLARLLRDKFMALLSLDDPAHAHAYEDRVQIMALKEFMIYGLRPILNSGMSSAAAFESFYTLNAKRIKLLVDTYDFILVE